MHWPMIQVKFVPLSMKDGTSSVRSFSRACPMAMIESLLKMFYYQTTTFGYSRAPLLLILFISLRAFPEMNKTFFLCKAR